MHEALVPVAFLLGTWRGSGHGEYPTIQSFDYAEEVVFRDVGRPFLMYTQRTWSPSTSQPMHSETGYWRPQAGGRIEIVLSHPFGIVEIQEGTIEGTTIHTASTVLGKTATAKNVERVERTFTVQGDVLRYDIRMAAVGVPLTHHLSADLERQPKEPQ